MFHIKFSAPLPSPLQMVTSLEELNEVRALRAAEYKAIYPSIDVYADDYDDTAIVFYTRDSQGQVNSTARLAIDGPLGLPEDSYFPPEVAEFRRQGKRLEELGRFVIRNGSPSLLKAYYSAFYRTAVTLKADFVLMAMKPKDVTLHQRLMGARLLSPDIGASYGGPYSLACVAWEIAQTKPGFFDWVGGIQ
ncbi:MAG: hypothetical protein KJ558_06895 [Gammaproteobacteria bacterium]|nr:hypothetical protein [Gammaproteobacteria bacterium]MBU1654545.1 hypothetical protein [Gammaproteobacteria bacterium]MBU1961937.1 hypothetical protein [Gammaproteobacteria bacterium]